MHRLPTIVVPMARDFSKSLAAPKSPAKLQIITQQKKTYFANHFIRHKYVARFDVSVNNVIHVQDKQAYQQVGKNWKKCLLININFRKKKKKTSIGGLIFTGISLSTMN
jgi:hypothetical protein